LESKEEEYLSSFVHSLLILEELNSVSYEEILFVELTVLELIVPVVNGRIAEEVGLSVSPLTFDEALSLVPTPSRFNRWRAKSV
jgi:hypothetical protein